MKRILISLLLLTSSSYAQETLKDILTETAIVETAESLSNGQCPKIGFDFNGAVKNILNDTYDKNFRDDPQTAFNDWSEALEISSNGNLSLVLNTTSRGLSPLVDIIDSKGEKKFEITFGSFKCKKFGN